MAEYKSIRKRVIGMLLPDHHESSLAVAVGGEATFCATVCSASRIVFASTLRTIATCAPLVHEARIDTGFESLVSQVLLDSPGFHLGDLLPGFPAESLLLFRVFLDSGRIAND